VFKAWAETGAEVKGIPLAAAQAWADADPYIGAGVYREVTVRPFKRVLP
jgi:uncharacterized protein YciI